MVWSPGKERGTGPQVAHPTPRRARGKAAGGRVTRWRVLQVVEVLATNSGDRFVVLHRRRGWGGGVVAYCHKCLQSSVGSPTGPAMRGPTSPSSGCAIRWNAIQCKGFGHHAAAATTAWPPQPCWNPAGGDWAAVRWGTPRPNAPHFLRCTTALFGRGSVEPKGGEGDGVSYGFAPSSPYRLSAAVPYGPGTR